MRSELRAVVAFVPSGLVWQNVASGFPDSSSWTYRGADVAFVHYGSVDQPRGIIDFYRAGIEQATPGTLAAATIPVERISGPILLLSGRDDNLWPSTDLSARVVERLAEQGFGYPVEHKAYENAGHLISRVRDEDVSRRGGTDQGNRTAQLDARDRMVTFLRQNLMPPEAAQDASAQDSTVMRLPAVTLPLQLERVLRDYERAWESGGGEAVAGLFTLDGFVRAEGGWIRGMAAIRARYANASGELRLRAIAYAQGDTVGYIVGAYGYGNDAAVSDRGSFLLALRRGDDGRWLIAADLDHSN